MAAFVKPLLANGKRVIALDCWGHGDSPGLESNGVALAESILQCARECGPFESIVGHSAGGAAIVIAINRGLQVKRAVLLAPPSIPNAMRRFARARGFSDRMTKRFLKRMEEHVGATIAEVDFAVVAPALNTPLKIIHDLKDREIPFEDSLALARVYPSAVLEPVRGCGHRRILRSPSVVAITVDFLTANDATVSP